jgi:DNA-binding transcriptional MocR family regulator
LIAQHFPEGTRVTAPQGGLFLWGELARCIDALELFQVCLAEKIVIAPGKMFSATNRFEHCIRLGLGGCWNDAHRHALRRVGERAKSIVPRSRV